MPEYRRIYIPGATIFITIVTYNRQPIFVDSNTVEILRNAWLDVSRHHPFTTNAFCLLPDHLHTLITLPENDADYSMRIREIKRIFTKHYLQANTEKQSRSTSHQQKQEAALWQRRFWEHTIKDEHDYQNHFDYIHYNPVKHGLVDQVSMWQWSTFHRYVREEVYQQDWGDVDNLPDHSFGE